MSLPAYNQRYSSRINSIWGQYPLVVNNYQMPLPRNGNYEVGRDYISSNNTKRANATGATMHKKTLATKTLVKVKYVKLPANVWRDIYNKIGPEGGQEFVSLKYFDPYTNNVQTKTFYVPATTTTVQYYIHGVAFVDVDIEFIEK